MSASWIKPAAFATVALVAVSFALLGAIECGFAAYYAITGIRVDYVPDQGLGIRSWTVHHAMRPGWDGAGDPREPAQRVRTNSLGLRDDEPVLPKPAGVYRVLFLGDSFTYGWRMTPEQSFVGVCERQLAQRDGGAVEIVNGGVASYSPMLSYLQYRHHLHVLEPDLVVINFDMSDVQDTHWLLPHVTRDAQGAPLFCREESLGRAPASGGGLHSLRWLSRRLAPVADPLADPAPGIDNGARGRYLWTLDDGPAWEAEARAAFEPIAHLAELLRARGIPLVVATYPYSWQVSATATPERLRAQLMVGDKVHRNDRPFRMLAAFAAEHGLSFVDATAQFRAQPNPDDLWLDDDLHWTARGHELYGRFLARELVRLVDALAEKRQ